MASPTLPMRISEVNSLSDEQFESVFGNVIELCTDAAVEVKKKRPFQDLTALCDAFQCYLDEIGIEGKYTRRRRIAILRCLAMPKRL